MKLAACFGLVLAALVSGCATIEEPKQAAPAAQPSRAPAPSAPAPSVRPVERPAVPSAPAPAGARSGVFQAAK